MVVLYVMGRGGRYSSRSAGLKRSIKFTIKVKIHKFSNTIEMMHYVWDLATPVTLGNSEVTSRIARLT